MVGKGITRFHCVIWPAMLLAADLALPRKVWAHGYVQWEATKMSKTAGTAVTLDEAIERHGPDALRYFLLREVGFEADGNFTWERFDERYIADLADGLGNLVSRSLAMIAKYREGVVPGPADATTLDQAGRAAVQLTSDAMDALDLRGGAEAAWALVATANLYIQQIAPWKLAKEGREARAEQRARGAGSHPVPTGGPDRAIYSGQGREHLAVPRRGGQAGRCQVGHAGCTACHRLGFATARSAFPQTGAGVNRARGNRFVPNELSGDSQLDIAPAEGHFARSTVTSVTPLQVEAPHIGSVVSGDRS